MKNPERFILFPIQDRKIWSLYKQALSAFWVVEEVDVTLDKKCWDSLTDGERTFISHVLAFFASADGIVADNLVTRFIHDVDLPEAKFFYGNQLQMEQIHAEMYAILIDTYITDAQEKTRLFHAITTVPCVERKAKWALKWILDDNASYATRICGFACVEGIFFSASFASIYYLKKRNLMPGLCFSNSLIARDEALHCTFACLLYDMQPQKLSEEEFRTIIMEAVDIEKQFCTESLPVRLIGMNSELMIQHIEFIADYWAVQLGHNKLYNSVCPFDFFEQISMGNKSNFFETRVSEYAKAGVAQTGFKPSDYVFSTSEDF